MKCPNCNKEIKDNYKFCSKCGYKLTDNNNIIPNFVNSVNESKYENHEKENKRNEISEETSKIITIITAIVIVVLIGMLCFFQYKSRIG